MVHITAAEEEVVPAARCRPRGCVLSPLDTLTVSDEGGARAAGRGADGRLGPNDGAVIPRRDTIHWRLPPNLRGEMCEVTVTAQSVRRGSFICCHAKARSSSRYAH